MVKNRIIVAHFGKQHSFQLANALKLHNRLSKYITTVYLKNYNITGLIEKNIKGSLLKRVQSRKNLFFDDKEVKQFYEALGVINLILMRIDKSRKWYIKWSRFLSNLFGKKVAMYTIKKKADAIVMYDTNALETFKTLEKKAPNIKRILDVSSATHRYMKDIYIEDIKRTPMYAESLINSSDYFWDDEILKIYTEEVHSAQYYLAPSEFVKKSLEYLGVDSNKIYLCPYGVDTKKFNDSHKPDKQNRLRCVYVGSITQRKGMSYLLEAFKDLDPSLVTLTLVGKYDEEDLNIKNYISKYNFTGFLPHQDVAEILSQADVMVFPSLSEGYSLAVLEALGSGIPIICTENVGAAEAIVDYQNGFVIPVGSSKAIIEKINWFLNNSSQIPAMRINARKTALGYTWDSYNVRVEKIIKNILEEE